MCDPKSGVVGENGLKLFPSKTGGWTAGYLCGSKMCPANYRFLANTTLNSMKLAED